MCAMLCAVSVSLTLALQWLWVKHVSRGPTLSDQFLQQSCQTSEAQEPAAFIFLMHGVCCVLSVRTPEGVYKSHDISNTGLRGRRHTEPGLSGRRYYRIYRHQRYNRHHRYNRYLRYNRYPRYNRSDLLQPSETITVYTVDSARLYQGPWWGISTTSLTPTPPIYRHHTTPLTLVGYKHYPPPSSRTPDRCRTGYPTPGATGGTGAAGPLLKGGVPEGGRWRRSNQPWRGYASAREWTTTA